MKSDERSDLYDFSDDFTRAIRIKAIEDYFKCSLKEVESSLKLQELVKERKILLMIDINNVKSRSEAISIGEFIEQLQPRGEASEK